MGIDVSLLGRFRVVVDGDAVTTTWPTRARQLLSLLVLSPSRQLNRERVVEHLWPHLDPEAGINNLHKAAHHLRRVTGDREVVEVAGGMVRLWPDRADITIDAAEFEQRAEAALRADDVTRCRRAMEAYPDALLVEDPYEEWTQQPRNRLRLLHERLAERVARPGAPGAAHPGGGTRPGTEDDGSLVGRSHELAQLRSALERARGGDTCMVLLRGPAGIGKTTLLRRLVDGAATTGWTTWTGSAAQAASGVPYGPLRAPLADTLAQRPDLRDRLGDPDRVVLDRLAGISGLDEAPPLPRHGVIGALRRLAVSEADAHGLVIAVDDADDVDAATAELLCTLAGLRGRPLLLALAYRTDAGEVLRPLVGALVATGAACTLDLEPLGRDEAARVVRAAADARVSDETTDAIVERAGGVPFHLEAMTRSVEPNGRLSGGADLQATLAARLSGGNRELADDLQLVACAGRVAVTQIGGLVTTSERAERVIATGAVERHGDHYRWRHRLLRDAVLAQVPAHGRAPLHGTVAERLAATDAAPLEVARHLLAAGRGADAVPLLVRAADAASAMAAWADALAIVETALDHAPDDPELLARRAQLKFLTGDPDAGLAFGAAVAAVPAGPMQDQLRFGQAWAWLSIGDLGAAEAALSAVHGREDDTAIGATVRAIVACFAGRVEEAGQHAAVARERAIEDGNTAEVLRATLAEGMVAHSRGEMPVLLRREVLASGRLPELAGMVLDGYLCPAVSWLHAGDPLAHLAELARQMQEAAAEAGAERGRAFATMLLGQAALMAGDGPTAAVHFEDSRQAHGGMGATCGEAFALVGLAQVAVGSARRRDADRLVDEAFDTARHSPLMAWHLLPWIHGARIGAATSEGEAMVRVDEARASLVGPEDRCPACWPALALPAVTASVRSGRLELAEGFAAQAAAVIAPRWRRGGFVAGLNEVRGLLAQDDDPETARRLLTEAADEFDRCGQAPDAARCRQALPA